MSVLGVFKDSEAINDTDDAPAERAGERCLNCNMYYNSHHGWCCDDVWKGKTNFYDLAGKDAYTTSSMAMAMGFSATRWASVVGRTRRGIFMSPDYVVVGKTIPMPEIVADRSSDWRAWRDLNRQPAECACGSGTLRANCRYHKEA